VNKHTIKDTDLEVSRICLGVADAGLKQPESESFRLYDRFCELGGNFLDTARVYSNWVPGELNRSERILGDWLASRKNRQSLVIATKGGHPELSSMHIPRLSAKEVAEDLNGSLGSLGTDYIDLYWLHRDDPSRPVGEIIEYCNEFARQGKIRYFACSNWPVQRIREANRYAVKHGLRTFVASQVLWNAGVYHMKKNNDPTIINFDAEMFRLHRETGFTAIPFSSQANGFFTYFDNKDPAHEEKIKWSSYNTPGNLKLYSVLRQTADTLQLNMTQVVLSYLLSQPIAVVPIVGCGSIRQLNESVSSSDRIIPDDMLELIEKTAESGITH